MTTDEEMDWSEGPSLVSWDRIPTEIKERIISFLPFPDKQNMMLVNWECCQICQNLPNKLHELGVCEIPSTAKTSLTIKWKNEKGRVVSKFVEFRGIARRQFGCPQHTMEAVKTFLNIWRKSKIKTIIIEIPCFEGLPGLWEANMNSSRVHISVRTFHIRTNDVRLILKCLDTVKNSKHEISLMSNDIGMVDSCLFDAKKIKEAKSVILWSLRSQITDKQFNALNAHNIRLESNLITTMGVIQMIKDWQQGRRQLTRLHIASPLLDINEIANNLECVCWQYLTDICQTVWKEVDEEGYTYALKGPVVAIPAAMGMTIIGGVPTFIFRIIKITPSMAESLTERCTNKCKKLPPHQQNRYVRPMPS